MRFKILIFVFFLFAVVSISDAASLGWQYEDSIEPSAKATAIEIERKVSGGAYAKIGQVVPSVKNFEDATPGTFCYRVRAVNEAGASAYSNEACMLVTPLNLKVTITITMP